VITSAVSVSVSWNTKSSGRRSRFRLTSSGSLHAVRAPYASTSISRVSCHVVGGSLCRCSTPTEITICDFKLAYSSGVNWNAKSR
jgi:hypothetical protein